MGYYPFYIPDTYLQAVKYIPNSYPYYRVQEIDPTARVHKRQTPLKRNLKFEKNINKQQGKGLNFDQYA